METIYHAMVCLVLLLNLLSGIMVEGKGSDFALKMIL